MWDRLRKRRGDGVWWLLHDGFWGEIPIATPNNKLTCRYTVTNAPVSQIRYTKAGWALSTAVLKAWPNVKHCSNRLMCIAYNSLPIDSPPWIVKGTDLRSKNVIQFLRRCRCHVSILQICRSCDRSQFITDSQQTPLPNPPCPAPPPTSLHWNDGQCSSDYLGKYNQIRTSFNTTVSAFWRSNFDIFSHNIITAWPCSSGIGTRSWRFWNVIRMVNIRILHCSCQSSRPS